MDDTEAIDFVLVKASPPTTSENSGGGIDLSYSYPGVPLVTARFRGGRRKETLVSLTTDGKTVLQTSSTTTPKTANPALKAPPSTTESSTTPLPPPAAGTQEATALPKKAHKNGGEKRKGRFGFVCLDSTPLPPDWLVPSTVMRRHAVTRDMQ